ncbi:Vi polysaccharide biosynthesis protein VipA/TviB [Cylindrospermopsis raciborskii S07]|uniref:nucleotide sugar dehydrogenase n=1 Tax=Cylindrospermopsis raciborskii TaxID=77022 RepID=UPI000C9DF33A|nr:nucleotide sugar dehydrogenase [Cylindrospermopsis raciborskii]PNK02972.1 Vi polysaccharide biosynthesis protein VipA/TviB [Cylindrospermopsis raciborskii S10]PNK05038.1 Vi polysaccharide biosynthesis protein VipA/TviB [Cylindrospermopsis raciborskii S14]PNK09247.1 Vi polysaccharide biosynthesis protein VipA/TviB [Cylindrospermopsis raciborskii S07]PNK13027.1 Vi polysaccharide biosynthesis protein VipA/TviB [Cylindrospermopsis raciborskii S06]PNK18203.1 Vi polysaccharide biosynthesis protei
MSNLPEPNNIRLAVIGLGYVGLPLALEFGKVYPTVGFDINQTRVQQLQSGEDLTREVTSEELALATQLKITHDPANMADCNVYIITVPTPIDQFKRPDLTALESASSITGKYLKHGDVVIYESTVYPGATEEICVPILEKESGLIFNQDFWCGYSPERINPGDQQHRLTTIIKVTSGSTPMAASFVNSLYCSIIPAGTHQASSIRVAEAAKVIENTQRDVNIALINELALIFNRLGIDTLEVLEAAGTKWNFLPFRPGLVGGHCIGVDPYYLTHKAQQVGYHPEVILSGRRINDDMGYYAAGQVIRQLTKRRINVVDARILVLGLTFKENCPDIRNTRVVDLINELRDFNTVVEVYDPWVSSSDAKREYGIEPTLTPTGLYNVIIVAVAHNIFHSIVNENLEEFLDPNGFVYDLKGLAARGNSVLRL